MLKSGQTVVHYLKSLTGITSLQSVFILKENILWLDISMHDIAISQIFDSLKYLFDHSPYLMRFEFLLLLSVLDLFIKRDSLQQLQNEVILISVLKNFKKSHEILMLQVS